MIALVAQSEVLCVENRKRFVTQAYRAEPSSPEPCVGDQWRV